MGPHGRVMTWQIAVPFGAALPHSPVARPLWHPPNHRWRARPTQTALSIRTHVENGHEPSSVSHLLRFRADTGWQNEPAWEWQVSSAPSPGAHDCRSVYYLLRPVRAVVPAQPQPEPCRLQSCVRYRWHSLQAQRNATCLSAPSRCLSGRSACPWGRGSASALPHSKRVFLVFCTQTRTPSWNE